MRRCLRKENLRLQHIGNARIEIEEIQSGPREWPSPAGMGRSWAHAGWISAFQLLVLQLVWRPGPSSSSVGAGDTIEIPTRPPRVLAPWRISPDHTKLLYPVSEQGRSQSESVHSILFRTPVKRNHGAAFPFWSPEAIWLDSSQMLTFRMDIKGRSVRVIAGASMGSEELEARRGHPLSSGTEVPISPCLSQRREAH